MGIDKDIMLTEKYLLDTLNENGISDFAYSDIAEVVRGSYHTKEPPEIHGGAFVVASLEAALWAFTKSTNFQDCALLIGTLFFVFLEKVFNHLK